MKPVCSESNLRWRDYIGIWKLSALIFGTLLVISSVLFAVTADEFGVYVGPMFLTCIMYPLFAAFTSFIFSTTDRRMILVPTLCCFVLQLVLLILIAFGVIEPSPDIAVFSFVQAGLIEEVIKMSSYLLVYRQAKSVYGVLLGAATTGFTFGVVENLWFVFRTVPVADPEAVMSLALSRFIAGPVIHLVITLIGAILLAYVEVGMITTFRWVVYPLALGIPVVLHGAYDFLVLEPGLSRIFSKVFAGFIFILACLMLTPLRKRREQEVKQTGPESAPV